MFFLIFYVLCYWECADIHLSFLIQEKKRHSGLIHQCWAFALLWNKLPNDSQLRLNTHKQRTHRKPVREKTDQLKEAAQVCSVSCLIRALHEVRFTAYVGWLWDLLIGCWQMRVPGFPAETLEVQPCVCTLVISAHGRALMGSGRRGGCEVQLC